MFESIVLRHRRVGPSLHRRRAPSACSPGSAHSALYSSAFRLSVDPIDRWPDDMGDQTLSPRAGVGRQCTGSTTYSTTFLGCHEPAGNNEAAPAGLSSRTSALSSSGSQPRSGGNRFLVKLLLSRRSN